MKIGDVTAIHSCLRNRCGEIAVQSGFGAVVDRAQKEVSMIYGSFNWRKVPENVVRSFPKTEWFGYELIQLNLRAVCDTLQDRDSMYTQAKDAHLYVAAVGPRMTEDKRWYGIYW